MLQSTSRFPLQGSLATTTARPANSLIDSIGVCVHLTYDDTAYYDLGRVGQYLQNLGVRYIRDGVALGRAAGFYSGVRAIAATGVKSNYLIGNPEDSDPGAGVQAQLSALRDSNRYGIGCAVSLEAPNEYDGFSGQGFPAWADKLYNHQRAVYPVIKTDPDFGGLPYLGPSFGTNNGRSLYSDDSRYPDRAQYLDAGNLHSYPGGRYAEINPVSAISDMATVSNTKPIYATETGYHTAVNSLNSGHFGVSERAQAIYLLRIFLEYFRLGVVRTFSYQLFDQKPNNTGLTDPEEHFGMVAVEGDPNASLTTWTLRPKAAYTALKNLISLVADPGSGAIPANLTYAVQATPATVRQLLLGRRDGSYDLILWNAVRAQKDPVYYPSSGYVRPNSYIVVGPGAKNGVGDAYHSTGYVYAAGSTALDGCQDVEYAKYFDSHDAGDNAPADIPVVVTLASPMTAKAIRPVTEVAWRPLGRGQRVLIPLGVDPTIVRLSP